MTPLRLSSRRNSKRSRRRSRLPAALLFLFVSPFLGAQGVELIAYVKDGIVRADIAFHWDKEKELIASLREGLESRITVTARLYDRRAAILPMFRNLLIEGRTFSQSAFFDFLSGKFIVETDLGRRITYGSAEELIRGFFTWPDVTLAERGQVSDPFVTVRIQFDPVRLMPPLTIVSLVGATGSFTSPWVAKDVTVP